jgi:flagellar M-ring protein FliF
MALVPTDVSRLKESARRFAAGFSRGQKAVTAAALLGIVVIAVVFMSLSGRPTYSILFTNLQPSDAAAITQQLTTAHVPYQLQNGGSTILVPQNDVDQQRLAAAAAGLPSQGTVGLSLLDKEGLTTSQLTQQADYLQALQGELEQTINSISGVTGSQVRIALPANQTFALGNTNPTGASVLVDLQPGHSLTYSQVQAITNLVGSAVPGLSASQVSVADNNGDLLAGPGVADSGAAQSNAESAYDTAQAAKISAYLASVLGPGNADVQVNAQLNFDQVKTTTQTLVAGANGTVQAICTSISQSKERYSGTGTPPGAAAGTVTGANAGTYTQSSTQKSCETGTKSQTVVQAPGSVVRQSVAVLVNAKALPKGVSLAQLQKGTAAAAGIIKARGDILSFSAAPFASQLPAASSATKKSLLTSYLKPGIALLLVLLVLGLLFVYSRRARKQARENNALVDAMLLEQLAPLPAAELATGELPAIQAPAQARIGAWTVQEILDAPNDEVASVLREWLHQS